MAAKPKRPRKRQSTTGKEYERIVASVYRQFGNDAAVTENETINGRQIDVAIRKKVAGHEILLVIECKDYRRRVEIKHVDSAIGMIEDVKAALVVIVSDSGFTKGAIERARKNGRIQLVSVVDTMSSKLRSRISVPVQVTIHDFEREPELLLAFCLDETEVLQKYKSKTLQLSEFSDAVRKAVQFFVEWFNEKNFSLPSGENTYSQTFDCSGCTFRLESRFAMKVKTFINPNLLMVGVGVFDHLASAPIPESHLAIHVDVENDPSWREVPNDYILKECRNFYKRLVRLSKEKFEMLSQELVKKWTETPP